MTANIIGFPKKKPKEPKIGIIIQARMTSTRFPGKSMAMLLGKPVVQHVMERAKCIRATKHNKPEVVLCVPDDPLSEPMLELADKLKVGNFLGDEHDVLKRYYDCAVYFNYNIIMRITGDCPFIDPRASSEVLQLLLWRKCDYASNVYPVRTYPRGLDTEVFTFDALEAAHKLTKRADDKEHVTPWMQLTPGILRANVTQKVDQSHLNWCVDNPEDIQRLEAMQSDKTY
jgi:spore coat polysaccharide biosynthesis protein SpsF